MGKRRSTEAHIKGLEYNLPEQKGKNRSRHTAFTPEKDQFLVNLNEAFKTKLKDIIKTKLQKNSDAIKLKKEEEGRNKVPPKSYEALDQEHDSYWIANRIKHFKLDALDIYKKVISENFDQLLKEVKETLKNESKLSLQSTSRTIILKQIKSIVVPFGQLLRSDLPKNTRVTIIDKVNNAIEQYSDFASMFSFAVEPSMINFVMHTTAASSRNRQINSVIPQEFQNQTHYNAFPIPPTHPSANEPKRYEDYKNLFSVSHLQVINTVNFGTTGITKKTRDYHQFWLEIQDRLFMKNDIHVQDSDSDDEFQATSSTVKSISSTTREECQLLFEKAKDIKSEIKKVAVAQLSVNVDNMYLKRKKFQRALDKILNILLKMHLQPSEERKRREEKKSSIYKIILKNR